jgi:hypothetical protein
MLAIDDEVDGNLAKITEQEESEWIEERYSGLDASEVTKEPPKTNIQARSASKIVDSAEKPNKPEPSITHQNLEDYKDTPRYGGIQESEDMVKFTDCADDKQFKRGSMDHQEVTNTRPEPRKVNSRSEDDQKENQNMNWARNQQKEWPDMKKILQVKDFGYSKLENGESDTRNTNFSREPKQVFTKEEYKPKQIRPLDNMDDSSHIRSLSKDLASEVFPRLNQNQKSGSQLRRLDSHPNEGIEKQIRHYSAYESKPYLKQWIEIPYGNPTISINSSQHSYGAMLPAQAHQKPLQTSQASLLHNCHPSQYSQLHTVAPGSLSHSAQQPTQETFSRAFIESLKDMHR